MTGGMTNANQLSMELTELPKSVGVFSEEEKYFWEFTGMMELKL